MAIDRGAVGNMGTEGDPAVAASSPAPSSPKGSASNLLPLRRSQDIASDALELGTLMKGLETRGTDVRGAAALLKETTQLLKEGDLKGADRKLRAVQAAVRQARGQPPSSRLSGMLVGRRNQVRWGAIAVICVAAFLGAFAAASINFNPQVINVKANYFQTNYIGVTAFQGNKAQVFFSVSAGLAGGLCNTTTVGLGSAAGISPVYLNATGGTTCGPGGFAEVFEIPTNTTAIGFHSLNFTFFMTYGGANTLHTVTIQVNTAANTALNTNILFYIVFSSFPIGGIDAFSILVDQTS